MRHCGRAGAGHDYIAEIESVGGALAIDAHRSKGCGYDLTGIQRIVNGGRKFILLAPVGRDDLRAKRSRCNLCDHSIKTGSHWCSLSCRAESVQSGRNRGAALLLVALAMAGHFGAPVLQRDRFCSVCSLGYCNSSCPNHLAAHHPGYQHAPDAILPFPVVTVSHVDGWAAVPQAQLPEWFVADVQGVEHPDGGGLMFPIQRRGGAQAVQAMHQGAIHQGVAHACQRQECAEVLTGALPFCSMRCRHLAG